VRIQPQSYRKQEIEKHDSFGDIEAQNHADSVEEKIEIQTGLLANQSTKNNLFRPVDNVFFKIIKAVDDKS